MTLICPDCKAHTLHINHALELPPDGYHDEIRLQLVGCVHCGLKALALYTESRRGSLDSDAWHHEGYRVSEADFRAVAAASQRCPRPSDKQCPCPTHQSLGQISRYPWDGLRQSGLIVQGVFAIKQSETQAAGPPDGG
jgi:hypothetical protein